MPAYSGLDFGGNAVFTPELGPTGLRFVVGFSTGPAVTAVTPSDSSNPADAPDAPFLDVTFREPADPATFTAADVTVTGPVGAAVPFEAPAVVAGTSGTRFRIRLTRGSSFAAGTYTLTVGPDVRDFVGGPMNQNGNLTNGEAADRFTGTAALALPDLAFGAADRGGLAFDGADDVVAVPDHPALGPTTQFTLEAWINPTAIAGRDRGVISKIGGAGGGNGYRLAVLGDGRVAVQFNAPGEGCPANAAVSAPLDLLGRWTHLAGTYDGNTLRVYVNGQLAASAVVGPKAAADTVSTLRIGCDDNNAVYFQGQIADARVWSVARTAAEIAAGRSGALAGTEPGLAANGRLDDTTGVAAPDRGPNRLDGTPGGGDPTASPAATVFGGTTSVTWAVTNPGTAATPGGWTDRVYLSSSATPGGRLLGTVATTDALAAGTSVPRSATVTIPADAIGTFYLVVATDDPNRVVEPAAEANNIDGHVLTVDLSPFADRAVTAAAAPNLVIGNPARVTVTWTVKNVNDAAGRTDTWVDRLVAVAANGAETVLGEFTRTGGLAPGASDTRTESLLLPPGMTGRCTLVVRTDATGAVFENGRETNNALAAPGDFDVMPIPYADLVVTSVRAGGAASGGPLTVSWRVANDGTGLTSVGAWADRVYLARDPQEIAGTDTGFEHFGFLAVGDGYDRTGTVAVPNGLTGTVYAVVVPADPDATRGNPPPFEFVYAAGNPKVSGPIGVAPSPTADLVVSAVSGPETAAEDGTIDVIWTVRNAGLAPAAAGWTDQVFLERTVTNERTLLGTFRTDGPLDPGKTSTRQEALRLPAQLTGVYRVVVVTNVDAVVYEGTAPANNTTAAAKTLSVAVRPRPDLQAVIVEAPPTITPGGTASVGFTVTNVGTAPTAGDWTDRVYLSLDNQFSVDDLLLDEVDSKLGLQPTAVTPAEASYRSDSVSFQVPERYRGYVYFLVVTDARRQVDEWPNDDNNVAAFKTYATPLPLPDLVVSDVRVDGGSVNRGDRAGRVHGDQPRPGGDAGAGVDRDGVADPRQGPPAPRPRR